ncbi:hypothetical protein GDO86_006477 [Hymenochirus boettgeri]|uniref:small monomeric GTPase n=1 Tax=Hymenochirus boettgeri TaxID=247094 RepID=A0A8T2J6C8_9PIPI|nr:hypothetical protein GDO86_006477 [Hymenochirus boettgeri]
MDTADQEGPVNPERYLHWAHVFLVVYSIDNKKSFEGCCKYLDILSQYNKGAVHESPVLLLGNKVDMERYRQVSKADGSALASHHGCLFREVSACLDFQMVQKVFHEAVLEVRKDAERSSLIRPPLYISEERALFGLSNIASPVANTKHGMHSVSTLTYKEIPSVAQAKLVTVKSSRAQSKRKAPTLTLLKGFKIF